MNAELTTQLLQGILGLLSIIISGFLIPYLKEKYSFEKRKQVYQIVKTTVQAVQQIAIATGMSGAEKKTEVVRIINGMGIKLNSEELDRMIESCVLELKPLEKQFIEP